jgi:rhomboid protease GluP
MTGKITVAILIFITFREILHSMALGINSRRSLQIPLKDLNPEQFIILAADTASKLGWGLYFINASGLIANTSEAPFISRDKVTLHISDGIAYLKSQPIGVKMPDPSSPTKPEFPAAGDKRKGATIHDFAASLEEARKLYTPEYLTAAFEKNQEHMAPQERNVQSLASAASQARRKGITGYFIPRKDYFITPLIIDINILVFILMVLSGVSALEPDTASLIAWGADYTPYTRGGQWWRLLTSTFVHIGIIHLAFNMYAFLYIGLLLEPLLGRWKFSIAYFVTGMAASAVSLYWHALEVGAGASGAIFGMYGVFLAMLTTNLIHKEKRTPLLKSIGLFVMYNLAFGVLGTIDNAAHIGGLVCGILIGYILYPVLKKRSERLAGGI